MDYGLILAVVAIIVTIIVAVLRSQGSKKQRLIMEQQLAHQRAELRMLREHGYNRRSVPVDPVHGQNGVIENAGEYLPVRELEGVA